MKSLTHLKPMPVKWAFLKVAMSITFLASHFLLLKLRWQQLVTNKWNTRPVVSCVSSSQDSGSTHGLFEKHCSQVPRGAGMIQPWGLRSKGVDMRAGKYKWMVKTWLEYDKVKQAKVEKSKKRNRATSHSERFCREWKISFDEA